MASHNLKPIGPLPHFPALKECYKSDEGFIFSEYFGGIKPTEALNRDFVVKEDDVFIVSFPKSGTTWLQEIVYLICTDMDYETAKKAKQFQRSPFLEFDCPSITGRSVAEKLKSPRLLKSHYPYSMIPESVIDAKCKIIYPIRNPKDTVVSYYFFSKAHTFIDFDSDFPTFFDLFLEGKVLYGPYWKHVTEFWNHRSDENILIVTYEDMQQDLLTVVKKICDFLGKSFSDQQLQDLVSHCSFSSMKANPAANPDLDQKRKMLRKEISPFLRKGQVGDWKNYLSEDMNTRMDEYMQQYFEQNGPKFVYNQD